MGLEVPRYEQPRVRPDALPGQRPLPAAPIEAFGGGAAAARAFEGAGDIARMGGAINAQEFNRDLESTVQDYVGRLSAEETKIKLGLASRKGSDAFGATDQALKDFDKVHSDLDKQITNPLVKHKVSGHAAQFRDSLHRASEIHTANEREAYARNSARALRVNERNGAVADYIDPDSPARPARVMGAIGRIRASIADEMRGQPQELINAAQAEEESKTHMGVLERMLVSGADGLGRQYYEANKDGIIDKAQAERWLQAQSSFSAASRIVEDAFKSKVEGMPKNVGEANGEWTIKETKPVADIEEFRERLPKNLDDKTREQALDLARARFRDIHIADEVRQDKLFKDSWNKISMGGQISPVALMQMDPNRQTSLTTHAHNVSKGAEPKTNRLKYAQFHAKSDQELRKMSAEQLDAEIRAYQSDEDYKASVKHWAKAQDPEGYKTILSENEILLDGFRASGSGGIKKTDTIKDIEKSTDKAEAFYDFKKAVDNARAAHHAATGENPDGEQMKKITMAVGYRMAKEVEFDDKRTQYGDYTIDQIWKDAKAAGIKKRIAALTPDDLRSPNMRMPMDFRAKMWDHVKSTPNALPQGWDIKRWQDENRTAINSAWIATQLGASDVEVYKILLGGK